ncbi:hypothetical protein MHBO_002168 [Bonamia ostreae]|uniref:Uncharacterized protein n=1 Tax=Bonamia ostreae TaxID=126728 RepID=A0ABV2ALK4_9EUKA
MEIRNSIMASFKSETSKSSTFINLGEKDLKAKFLKEKTWRELSHKERLRKVGKVALIAIAFFLLLILFFANISMMSAGIKIISGYHTRNIFEFANNEMAGLSIGIIATVIFQSSSTTTSLTVALVASNVLTVKYAIPIIMGANVGTSVTNTLVSLGHINDATQFRRAMQGATVHDFFNIFLVLIFLPTQMIPIYDGKGWMELLSYYLVMPLPKNSNSDTTKKLNFIKHMTEPYVNSFLKINKCLLKLANIEGTNLDQSNFFQRCIANCASKLCPSDFDPSQSNIPISKCPRCSYYFKSLIESGILKSSKISDSASAGIAIAISLILIISSLFALTKLMSFALKKQTSNWIKRALLKNVVVGMLVGCVITIIIQSSSITTSSLVPLVALNVITVQQMFPVTLGALIFYIVSSTF